MARSLFGRHKKKEAKLEMAPMVDVVFQLLIFFLVASEVKPTEADFKTNLPGEGEGPRDVKEETPEPARLEMEVVGGSLIVKLNGSQVVDGGVSTNDPRRIYGVFRELERRLRLSFESSKNLLYIIDGAPKLEVKYVAMALDAGRAAGLEKITFEKPDSKKPAGRKKWTR